MVARVRYRRWFMTKTLPLDPLSSSLLMEPELLLPLNGCLDISKGKRAAPPKAEKLVDHHLDVAMKAVAKFSGHPLILVGKSMGSRGSKDGMCPLEKLNAVRKKLKTRNELYVVDGGDHSLKVGKQTLKSDGVTQAQVEEKALTSIAEFISSVLECGP